MRGNDAKALLDMNSPGFPDDLFDLDTPALKRCSELSESPE